MEPATDPLPPGTEIGRTALRVADRERLTEFYTAVVGLGVLRVQPETTVLGVDDAELVLEDLDADAGDGTQDDAHRGDAQRDDAPAATDRGGRQRAGLYHNAFRVPSRAALGDALSRIENRWRLDGASDHGVSEALYCTDPEGNGVEIYRDYPREVWPTDDGRIAMGTEPLDRAGVAAAAAGEDGLPAGTDVGHVHLQVTALDAFRRFAVDVVGLAVRATVPDAVFLAAGDYHHHLAANTWQRPSGPASGPGLAWFELRLPDGALGPLRERLRTADVAVTTAEDGLLVRGPDDVEIRFTVAD